MRGAIICTPSTAPRRGDRQLGRI